MARVEDQYVKIPALIHAARVGYSYLSIRDKAAGIDWDADTNIFFEQFRASISQVNAMEISEDKATYLISKIKAALSADDLGKAFFNCLHKGIDGLMLLDFDHIASNTFNVVTELPYANGEDSFRPDIVFLVNGMPLGFMEVKRQNNKDGILAERERMYSRFRNEIYRRFVNITQMMAFSNNQEYDDTVREPVQGSFYASSAYGSVSLNRFREEDVAGMAAQVAPRDAATEKSICRDNNLAAYYGSAEYESSVNPDSPANRIVTSLFSPERFMFLLQYGICYVEKTDDDGIKHLEKHVMRYPQLFATRAVRRTLDDGQKKGVIWHTQGSGKTALSFFLTRYLQDYYQGRNKIGRFFFIVDRIDLADQAADEMRSRGVQVNIVNSKAEFAEALKDAGDADSVDKSHTITVVNIQKFSDDSSAVEFDYNLNVQRVYFIDEAHRDYKQGKTFLANLVTSDRDAVMIALTGTPLIEQKGGNDTKAVFGPYIHRYFYNQSIADGYTLKLLREEIATGFKLKMQQTIDELKKLFELEELKGEVGMAKVFEHDNYVRPLTDYIVSDYVQFQMAHDDAESEPGVGAMIVAYSAPQARKIYAELQQLDQDISSALVLHDEGSKEDRRKIQDDFKKGGIDILVVYNMLLTGFDAHRLKKMYLCRKISAHNLLQALTRVNRPFKNFAFGYVVDFQDITEEYDRTNRSYLRELTEELGDATQEYSSLFESPEQVKADLAKVKDMLAYYSTDNAVEFINEIGRVDDKKTLYELRYALQRYAELRNVAKTFGYEGLYESFDITRAQALLREVNNRIDLINKKEALALKDMSTGAVNVLLAQMEFTFRKIGSDELAIADEFQDKLKRTRGSFAGNIDQGDPEYVNLLEELKRKFEHVNIEDMTSSDMMGMMGELDALHAQVEEINRKDAQLQKKYGGDAKFVRIHKTIGRTPPPITESPAKLITILQAVKGSVDDALLSNSAMLGNRDYFEQSVRRLVIQTCSKEDVECVMQQVNTAVHVISNEYFEERRRAS